VLVHENSVQLSKKEEKMNASHGYLPLNYFLLVLALSIPIWLLGGNKLPLPINLPVSALTTFIPMIAASILIFQRSGFVGVKELLNRAWDFKKIKTIWYLPALLLAPLIYLLSYALIRLTGLPLPVLIDIPLLVAPAFFILFLISKSGKSVMAANLYHTTDNLCWSLFPNFGSHYNPIVTGLLTWLMVIIVIFGWGTKISSLTGTSIQET
jgi:hypothetical protein